MTQEIVHLLQNAAGETQVCEEEPMSRHTTFRIGGAAEVLVSCNQTTLPAVIQLCIQSRLPFCIIGNGSNLLVGDKGIRGVVIQLQSQGEEPVIVGNELRVFAGTLLSKAANAAAAQGLSGMEFAAGIPGSVGGAVVMNAGAYGGEIKEILKEVTVLDQTGATKVLSASQLELGYRQSCIPKMGYVVLEAVFILHPADQKVIRDTMEELRKKRVEKQPLEYPSAGSTFKRPEGYFAGKLIMDAGLRGYSVGGAQVSEKHCGFVVNKGGATAQDVCQLMQDVSQKVREQFGVTLEPEIKFTGDF